MSTLDYADRLSQLSPEKRAQILELLRKQRRTTPSRLPTSIPLRATAEPARCSHAQQRLWFAEQFAPGSPTYNVPLAVHLDGPLDSGTLARSLNEIVRRHEALRTVFATRDGEPIQVVQPAVSIPLPVVRLEELPSELRDAEYARLVSEFARRPFDLASGPLIRAMLVSRGELGHSLLLSFHHIVADLWSIDVLLSELSALYDAFAEGRSSPLPELPVQYPDVAVWQRDRLQGDVLDELLSYWRQQLASAPSLLELPTDRPRPPVVSQQGAFVPFDLPAGTTLQLDTLCRMSGVTPFQALLAAYAALLHRYTGSTVIPIASPVANRDRVEVEKLIGFFVNTVVLSVDLSGAPSFRELLGRVREAAVGAYAHQDLPFEMLVDALRPDRSLSHAPLAQVMFTYEQGRSAPTTIGGVRASIQELETATAKLDLALMVSTSDSDCLHGEIEYSTDLFDASTIARIAGHFATLLTAGLAAPDTRVADLPLLTNVESRQFDDWNLTDVDYPRDRLIQELVADQAARASQAIAVRDPNGDLTYGELDRRANQLAQYLQRLGVGPDTPVGICLERSTNLLVGELAILKSGGAFVPLDPVYPAERLGFMMQDARTPIVLTLDRLVPKLPERHAARVVRLDADRSLIAAESAASPACRSLPDNLAYVIYTSGSTGQPKGVQLTNRGLMNLAVDQARTAELAPDSRVLQITAMSFDPCVMEIFTTLISGATLCIPPEEAYLPGLPLIAFMEEQAITTMFFSTPALPALPDAALPALRTIVTGGDACPPEQVARWAPGRRFVHAYGPTETTVCATVSFCEADGSRPTMGRPISNTRVFLLDRELWPVPVGVPGEVYIAGDGLARGYLDRPDMTAERFVPHPFSAEPGARLYRTGDLAKYLSDGNIEFVGRVDHQVKLRGFRIELGEIEAVLEQRPDVREAVVIVREDTPGLKRLVAYVVPTEASASVDIGDLRNTLADRLPPYMLPAAFVTLEAFPLSTNHKVDVKRLPAPLVDRSDAALPFVPPTSELERDIAQIWRELLGVERIGIRDNFFDLGGSSLLVVRLQTRLKEQLGFDVPVVALFQHPSIGALAEHLGSSQPRTSHIEHARDRAVTRLERRAQRREVRSAQVAARGR